MDFFKSYTSEVKYDFLNWHLTCTQCLQELLKLMTNNELVSKYVSDIASAERMLLQSVKNQVDDPDLISFPDAHALFRQIITTTELHIDSLNVILKQENAESRSSIKETISATVGAVLGVVGHVRTHNVSKYLRDDYTSLSLNAIGYSQLYTTALAVGHNSLASLALTHLKHTAHLVIEISQVVISVVVEELKETTTIINPLIAETAKSDVRQVWRDA